jgi:hypothetical protein
VHWVSAAATNCHAPYRRRRLMRLSPTAGSDALLTRLSLLKTPNVLIALRLAARRGTQPGSMLEVAAAVVAALATLRTVRIGDDSAAVRSSCRAGLRPSSKVLPPVASRGRNVTYGNCVEWSQAARG